MVRESKKKEEKPKDSPFKKFLKKRAPVYLGIIALLIVFVVPELTKGNLETSFPETLTEKEKEVLDFLMDYKGKNETGLSIMDAISQKIEEQYPNEKIYDNKKTSVNISISDIESQNYHVLFDFESYKGNISYDWNVNLQTGEIIGNDESSKHIIDLVEFYD